MLKSNFIVTPILFRLFSDCVRSKYVSTIRALDQKQALVMTPSIDLL